jgi:hypothetical protein
LLLYHCSSASLAVCHPQELQALPPPLTQSEADSIAAALGVELNRLQNIVISLDKAKYCLGQQGQCREAPLVLMSDAEVAEYLWNGERSVARKVVRAAAAAMLAQQVGRWAGLHAVGLRVQVLLCCGRWAE